MTTRKWATTGIGVFVAAVIVLQLLPFYVALTTAFKPPSDLSSQWLPPTGMFLGNFRTAVESGGILRAILNSAVVTVTSTVLVCIVGALAAYPLARRPTRWNAGILLFVVGAMIVPPLSILVPLYTLMIRLDAVNTYWGVILVMVTSELPLAIFLYAAFIRNIPISLEEAGRVDGANVFQVFFRIVLPLLKPVTATVVILVGVHVWNEYQLSLYMLTTPDVRTIAPSVGAFFSESSNNLGAASAAALLGAVPVVIAYLFLQRYFIRGMVLGAEK